jgi:hypothetical protein
MPIQYLTDDVVKFEDARVIPNPYNEVMVMDTVEDLIHLYFNGVVNNENN